VVVTSAELGPESDSELYEEITDPSSRQGGSTQHEDRKCMKVIKIWSWAPNGGPKQEVLAD
jgi:hypothetical protein